MSKCNEFWQWVPSLCTGSNPLLHGAASAPGAAVSSVAGDALTALSNAVFGFFGLAVKMLTTFWLHIPSPDLTSSGSFVKTLDSLTLPLVNGVMVLGLVAAGANLAWHGRWDDGGRAVLSGIVKTVCIVAAGGLLLDAVMYVGDHLGTAILNGSFNGVNVGARMTSLAEMATPLVLLGPGATIFLFVFAAITELVQVAIMLMRGPILVLLVALWPVAAAATVSGHGSAWFKRLTSWLISWSLYKLFASLIFAVAFGMIGQGTDAGAVIGGVLMLMFAVVALPAMLRLVHPAVEAASHMGAGAVAAAGVQLAAGAVMMSGHSFGGGGSQKVGGVSEGSGQPAGAVPTSSPTPQPAGAARHAASTPIPETVNA